MMNTLEFTNLEDFESTLRAIDEAKPIHYVIFLWPVVDSHPNSFSAYYPTVFSLLPRMPLTFLPPL
jgi:hypothetical protein